MGPDALEPGLAPGGLVLRVYGPDGALITERRLPAAMFEAAGSIEAAAAADGDAALEAAVDPLRMVIFDGDSGDRMWPPIVLERGRM